MPAITSSVLESSLTLADLFRRFGPMSLGRIRTNPPPGTATERDMLRIQASEDRLCELVDGILVEKAMGAQESFLAVWIGTLLTNFVRRRRAGIVLGPDGPLRLRPGLVRMPDVCFISRDRLPGGKLPTTSILNIAPNLAIEVLSPANTPQETRRKLREYFAAGVQIVWLVDLRARTVEVFTSPGRSEVLTTRQTLTGGTALPGFKVRVRELFSELADP